MNNYGFDDVWKRILLNEGQVFRTKKDKEFKYRIENNIMITTATEYNLSKNNFKKAFEMLPVKGPGEFRNEIIGSAYVWAVLNDKRIIE